MGWKRKFLAVSQSDYENVATIALNVWKTAHGWCAVYAGIGTRFGAYAHL